MELGAPLNTDLPQRQSIIPSFLRGRRASQSHQLSPIADQAQDNTNLISSSSFMAPSASSVGHRRRPAAAGALQPSISSPQAPQVGGTLSQMLRRRRSANGAIAINTSVNTHGQLDVAVANGQAQQRPAPNPSAPAHRIRFVPALDSHRTLHFDPITRDAREGDAPLRIGRFTDRSGQGLAAANAQNHSKLAFKSKVVSRAHAEVWVEAGGKFFIKDTKSSSGTFLNHVRLSLPNTESRPFPVKDGDILQLGVDYQGGTEDMYKCVKIRIEVGREWQTAPNAFNTNAMKQLKALAAPPPVASMSTKGKGSGGASKTGLSDCCICLFSVTVHQSLFIAPCSHVFHYKCIRPLLIKHHPGFSCPLCRTFANLEEDVEVDQEDMNLIDSVSKENAADSSAMDVDTQAAATATASAILAAADAVAASHATGAETEVEGGISTLRGHQYRSASALGGASQSEDADEFVDELEDDDRPLPPLPVANDGMDGWAGGPIGVARTYVEYDPNSEQEDGPSGDARSFRRVTPPRRNHTLNAGSANVDNDDDFVELHASGHSTGEDDADGMPGEGDASGSSGEGQLSDERRTIGSKRKR